MDRGELCLHELFEEQARKTPEETAVADERGELTYGELDRKADRLAAYLRGEGVGPDEVVGVYLERRLEFVVACLAALKAGGAFLPLELAYPPSLLGDVLDDSEPRVIDRKSTRLNSSHANISYAVFCLKKKRIY